MNDSLRSQVNTSLHRTRPHLIVNRKAGKAQIRRGPGTMGERGALQGVFTQKRPDNQIPRFL